MFSIADRKKLTNQLFLIFEKLLYKITQSNIISGYLVAIFHYTLVFVTLMLIISKHIGNLYSLKACIIISLIFWPKLG